MSNLGKLTLGGISPWRPIEILEVTSRALPWDEITRDWSYESLSRHYALETDILTSAYPPASWFDANLRAVLLAGCYAVSRIRHPAKKTQTMVQKAREYTMLVPRHTMLGDVVVSFQGSLCLQILRPLPNSEYMLVGSAIVLRDNDSDDLVEWQEALYLKDDQMGLIPDWAGQTL